MILAASSSGAEVGDEVGVTEVLVRMVVVELVNPELEVVTEAVVVAVMALEVEVEVEVEARVLVLVLEREEDDVDLTSELIVNGGE